MARKKTTKRKFVDFRRIQKDKESHRIVPVISWGGDVRLNRLLPADFLALIDSSKSGDEFTDNLATSVTMLSKMIANEAGKLQFDSDDGRAYLAGEIDAINELLDPATKLNGLG